MGFQCEWQVGGDDGRWETVAQVQKKRRLRLPWWAWLALAALIVALAGGGYLYLRRRYREVDRRVRFQIQGVIDQEARAFAEKNLTLFLAQQDEESPEWYEWQRGRFRACTDNTGDTSLCRPVLSAKLQDVDLVGDIAWVEVLEGEPPVRRVRFYRRTGHGWKHTAPRARFWKTAVELRTGTLSMYYHDRDQPHVGPLLDLVENTYNDVCATVYCPAVSRLKVEFSVGLPIYATPHLERDAAPQGDDKIVLASPWLYGIPQDGAWDEAYLGELRYWVAYAAATRAMQASLNRQLNPLQEAVLSEYAFWYAHRDPAQAPLLGLALEQQGQDALPDVLRELKKMHNVSAFLQRWLGTSPADPEMYFGTLLLVERRAIRAGRKKTFLLLQDAAESWQKRQEAAFERVQGHDIGPASVRRVEILHRRAFAHVTGNVLQGEEGVVNSPFISFRRNDGDWLHSAPIKGSQ